MKLKEDGVKAVCVRCGAEEAINSRRDGQGPRLVRSLGWTVGGPGGTNARLMGVKADVVSLPMHGSIRQAVVAPDEVKKTKTNVGKFAKYAKYRNRMLEGKPRPDGQEMSVLKPSDKMMVTRFGDNWLVTQAI